MTLSEFHESTIVEVSAGFGFSGFECLPSEITAYACLDPDETMVKGDFRLIRGDRTIENAFSSWWISSNSESKDVNVHLRQLLDRISPELSPFPERFGTPSFSILWKGNYLYAGSGPFYESDVLLGMARLNAMLWHDIYQIDENE